MAENIKKPDVGSIREEAEQSLSAFGDIQNVLNGLISTNAKWADSFKAGTSQAEELGKKLKTIDEKSIKDKKTQKQLAELTKSAQKEVEKSEKELATFARKRATATEAEKKIIDKIVEAKQTEIEHSKELIKDTNQILDYENQRGKALQYILDKFKNIQSINSLLSKTFFLNQMFKISEQTTQLQKSLLLSAEQATNLRNDFTAIANASGDNFITTDKLLAANAALGKQLGFNKDFGADLDKEFVNLTKRVGLTEESAAGFAKASILSNRTLKSTAQTASGIVSSVSSQYGIQLDIRDVLNEAGAASAIMLSNFKGSSDALVDGVANMKALGTSLSQTDQQAASLLDFETSIENQLKASLLTGKQINLEKARELALNNDLTGVAEELSQQSMDFNEFSNLNRIQQEGIAKSLGLSRDTLADQLLKQAVQGKSQSDIVALYGEEAYERSKSLSAQDKLNAAIEKMSDLFGNLAAGPLGKVVDLINTLSESTAAVSVALGVIAAVQFNNLLTSLAGAAVKMGLIAVESIAAGSALTIGIGAVAIAGGIIAAIAAYNSAKSSSTADDLMSGYGDRTLITPQGTYALNNNDTVIAGTNLFKGNDVYSGPKDSISLGGNIDYDKLASAMGKVQVAANVRVNDIANPVTVYQQQNIRRSV